MWEFAIEYRDDAQRIASLLIGLAMWRWGGAPERALALTFICFFTLPIIVLDFTTVGSVVLGENGYVYVVIDTLAFVAFVAIALQSNRNYPLWIAGFQLVALAAYAVRGLVDAVSPLAFAIMVMTPSYYQLALMAAGLALHIRREKRFGSYRDWRMSPQQPWPFADLRDKKNAIG